jgi:glucosyl-dolichyl phosphate glucuronosyltransferase
MASCSIILPSRNGADTLPMTLAALADVEKPHANVEIILVDNRSTDSTPTLMHEFAMDHEAQFIQELKPGKSHALNTGISSASGELLVFMDDDVIVSKKWLKAFCRAADSQVDVGVFAGQVRPSWQSEPPDWLKNLSEIGMACGCTSVETPAGPITPSGVKGANVAVRKSTLGSLRFDTQVSNYGASSVSVGGEDTRLMQTLEGRGNQISYVMDALVQHLISENEMTISAVFKRYARIGRSGAAISGVDTSSLLRSLAKIPCFATMAVAHLIFDQTSAAKWMTKAATSFGELDYALHRNTLRASSNH